MADVTELAAERIRKAYETGECCNPVRDLIGATDVDAAYAVQELNTKHALANGRELTGRKIGLTSAAVQKQLGVGQPDFGMLFSDMECWGGEAILTRRFLQPRVETEIALILDCPLEREAHTIEDILGATAYLVAAIEIVDSRVAKWDIRITDTIADNASSGGYILGKARKVISSVDLVNCRMTMERRGTTISEGTGAACLGSPLNAAVWLADTMVKRGRPLRAGDVVLTGALGPMVPVSSGDDITATVEGIGTVRAVFA